MKVETNDIDRLTRHLWHASQHDRMVIGLSGRIQDVVDELRQLAGLEPLLDSILDREFGECSVHVSDCKGQETH